MSNPDLPRGESLTGELIRRYALPETQFGRRGYDKRAVDELLSSVAGQVDMLRNELAEATRQLRYREYEIEQRRHGVGLPASGDSGEFIHEEQLVWHVQAQRYGDHITAVAQVQAEQIVEDAQTHAGRIRAAAEHQNGAVHGAPQHGAPHSGEHRVIVDPAQSERLLDSLRAVRDLLAQAGQQIEMAGTVAADISRTDQPRHAGPRNESPRSESPRSESPRSESPRGEPLRVDYGRHEAVRGDFGQPDRLRPDLVRSENGHGLT